MRIARVEIENFRCIRRAEVDFDAITALIGPNGAGKSTILRALNWVFNEPKDSLDDEDLFAGAPEDEPICVTVRFTDLTARDRKVLTPRYAPEGATEFAVRRVFGELEDRLQGAAQTYPGFAEVRALQDGGATPFNMAYDALRADFPDLERATSKSARIEALKQWEIEHPDLLEPQFVSDTQMFGFAGQGTLARIFQFVFVHADFRGAEESEDNGKSIVGRLLARLLNRSAAEAEVIAAIESASQQIQRVTQEKLEPALQGIAARLNETLGRYTSSRAFVLRPEHAQISSRGTKVVVRVQDGDADTAFVRQGHGFQRAAIIATLQLLSEAGQEGEPLPTLLLAIEEPELFQHPNQARAFAKVLRRLAESGERSTQIAYATHSPHFVDPFAFEQIRRVTKASGGGTEVRGAIRSAVWAAVGTAQEKQRDSQFSRVLLRNLGEALFAEAVLLCEGSTDQAVFDGASGRIDDLDRHGLSVAYASGKDQLPFAHAVLSGLGIRTLVVFDNDSGVGVRKREALMAEDPTMSEAVIGAKVDDVVRGVIGKNRRIASHMGIAEAEDFPVGLLAPDLFAIDDTLETVLERSWPQFQLKRHEFGEGGKDEIAYRYVASECEVGPEGQIKEVIEAALAFVGAPAGELGETGGGSAVGRQES